MANTRSYTPRDLYKEVTDRIIEALEQGTAPWVCPWTRSGNPSSYPVNGASGRAYNGVNVLILWATAGLKGYQSNQWFTFPQACEALGFKKDGRGRYIPEPGSGVTGEKSTPIVFYQSRTRQSSSDLSEDPLAPIEERPAERSRYLVMRHFNVWNREQIAGLPPIETDQPLSELERIEAAEGLLRRSGARITEGGDRACYRLPPLDDILLPQLDKFDTAGTYYATAFHELVHWSGGPDRLARLEHSRFGSPEYAEEELVAEIGSAYLCAHVGIAGNLQHAAYIDNWLQRLRNDKKLIFRAAAQARRAAEYLGLVSTELEGEPRPVSSEEEGCHTERCRDQLALADV